MYILSYLQNLFPTFEKVGWKTNRSLAIQINEYIKQLGDNFESIMTSYFEDFKKSMKQRLRIPVSLVEKHEKDIFFLVDIDFTYIQVAIPRVRWLRPLGYEINVDEASTTITTLLSKEMDKEEKPFGTYDNVKSRVEINLRTTLAMKKKEKMVKKLKERLGVEDDEEDDEEE